jgi:hypothetical protein
MSKPDTSREAVETMAHEHISAKFKRGMTRPRHIYTGATLLALMAERDEARDMSRNLAHALGEARAERDAILNTLRSASLDQLAANDAPLLAAEAAFAAGAEAMRRALDAAAEWFEEYAEGHQAKGAIDKASRNLERANACRRAALANQQLRHD